MSTFRDKKIKDVEELRRSLSSSNMIIFWNFSTLTSSEASTLRKDLKNNNAINKVYKNRIAKLAFSDDQKNDLEKILIGTTAITFSNDKDNYAILKVFDALFEKNKNLNFKAGYIDGKFVESNELVELSKLPSKEVLLSKLLWALKGSYQKLAMLLLEVEKKKSLKNDNNSQSTE